jgi:hypothetical protein
VEERKVMEPINYRYFIQGHWTGPAAEKPAVTGAKFLRTLDSLNVIDPLFSDWQVNRNWKISEDDQPRMLPLDTARDRIVEIVEQGVAHDDFGKPSPGYGYSVLGVAGVRGPRRVAFSARTSTQYFRLEFGEHNIESDLSMVTCLLFKKALQAISMAWDAQWSYAQAIRNDVVKVPINFAPGVPAFRMDSAPPVPIDPTFPKSAFHVPWIIYLSAKRSSGVTLAPEIMTEHTPDGGLLMSATTERLDPMNPEHARRARILAETMIACTKKPA